MTNSNVGNCKSVPVCDPFLTFSKLWFSCLNLCSVFLIDILADQGSPLLQDPDILHFTSYPSMQYTSIEPTMSSSQYYSNQNYYPPYNGDEWYSHTGIYELKKGPLEVSYDTEVEEASSVVPNVCKRTRHMPQAGRVKGEELCVVCGDKASGYHYNALTCEGCKGEQKMHQKCIGCDLQKVVGSILDLGPFLWSLHVQRVGSLQVSLVPLTVLKQACWSRN